MSNPKIRIHDDGKGKYHSFRARYLDHIAFGQSEEEAKEELAKELDKYIERIENIDWSKSVKVSWDDKEIEE